MKKIKLLLVMSVLALSMVGCGIGKMVKNYPQVDIKLENEDLENKGGKVEYTIKGTVPPKYLKKKAHIEIEVPYLVYDENGTEKTEKVGTITLVGEKSKESGTTIPYKTGGSFTKSGTFDYKEELESADIKAVSTIAQGKNSQPMSPRLLGTGVANTAGNIKLHPAITETDHDGQVSGNGTFVVNAPHQYKPEFVSNTTVIYFEVNMYNLNWNLKLNKDKDAKENIKNFVNFLYEGRVIDKVIIYGWASPEGEESRNQGLSEKRFEQGKKWFQEQFNKYTQDYAKKNKIKMKDVKVPELVFENHAQGEDWSGFEAAVEKSNIKEKNQILNVVRSQSNSTAREQKIREMTDIYTEIAEMILPPLRRSEITLVCNKNNFNDEQILHFAIANPDTLSVNEKLYAAFLTKDVAKKETIYSEIISNRTSQNEWRAYNNLAVIHMNNYMKNHQAGDLNSANDYLNKANAISPSNGIVLNNTAIVKFLENDMMGAKTKFEESQKATLFPIPQNYNLGMYKILDGDYAGAQTTMGNKHCDYNVALAQLLNKQYDAAKAALDCIPEPNADVFYLKAVLGARMKNETEVSTNLQKAISLDASMAQKAAKDPEFKKYSQITGKARR
jgi:outer membrane protein OmpA-like peptidoglycan-associated protein